MSDIRKQQKNTRKANTTFAEPKADDIKFADPTSSGEVAVNKNTNTDVSTGTAKALKGKKASKVGALNVDMDSASDAMRSFMDMTKGTTDTIPDSDIDTDFDYLNDLEAPAPIPEPTVPDNLPAKISKDAIHLDGGKFEHPDIEVHWHNVSDLPGYAIEQIRGAFRPLLKFFTGNQLEDLRMAATTDGSTSLSTMKQAIGYIAKYGEKIDEANINMDGIPNYEINNAIIYHLDDKVYLVAKETFQGQENYYIYEGDRNMSQLTGGNEPKRLS